MLVASLAWINMCVSGNTITREINRTFRTITFANANEIGRFLDFVANFRPVIQEMAVFLFRK